MDFLGSEVTGNELPTADAENGEGDAKSRTGRRAFFFFGTLAAANVILPGKAAAQVLPKTISRSKAGKQPQQQGAFPLLVAQADTPAPGTWSSPEARLLRRATLGITGDELTRVRLMSYQGWLNRQINPSRINDDIVESYIASRWPVVNQEPEAIYNLDFSTVVNQLREASLYRAAFSEKQLYERMVEFWSDHFNIAIDKVGYYKVADDRDVIRRHAMGNFGELLMASAKSPAMLAYLDQTTSRVNRTNENYARELLELHTLGADSGYTQQDIVELARVLTGWTVQGRGRFAFDPNGHDWGEKTVLGQYFPATPSANRGQDGIQEGESIIRMLVDHPTTARFIARKLLMWLLTPDPTAAQVKTVASVFSATGGDIRLTVRAVLNQSWLTASPVKLKRPFHFLVSGLRSLNPSVTGMNTMNSQVNAMGHLLFDWETPDGYPDKIEYWAGNVITRWNAARILSTSSNETVSIDLSPYLGGTSLMIANAINDNFFGGELSQATFSALIAYMNGGTLNEARIKETLSLAMSSSEFQWY